MAVFELAVAAGHQWRKKFLNVGLAKILDAAAEAEARYEWLHAAWLYKRAIGSAPHDHRLFTNLGNVLWLADCPDHALEAMRQAIRLAPRAALPHRGLGNILRDLNRLDAAVCAYLESLRLQFDPLTAWNLSQSLLGLERYDEAFAAAEARLSVPSLVCYRPPPYLDEQGEKLQSLAESPLYLWSEQGFGDTLQYVRWLVPLCQRPNLLCLEVEPQLLPLLEQGFSWLPYPPRVVAKVDSGVAPLSIQNAQASLMSLPHRLGGAPLLRVVFDADEDGRCLGYLRNRSWPRAVRSKVPRVGVVWAAGRKLDDPFSYREYCKRTLHNSCLGVLLQGIKDCGAELVNLQHGHDRDQVSKSFLGFSGSLSPDADFAETAKVVLQLDLVITVDTAMAHLSGALGQTTWVLLPYSADPRWLCHRSDSVWYPTLRLFRQPQARDWEGVIRTLLRDFSSWCDSF